MCLTLPLVMLSLAGRFYINLISSGCIQTEKFQRFLNVLASGPDVEPLGLLFQEHLGLLCPVVPWQVPRAWVLSSEEAAHLSVFQRPGILPWILGK